MAKVNLTLSLEERLKDDLRAFAKSKGKSLNQFLIDAAQDSIRNDIEGNTSGVLLQSTFKNENQILKEQLNLIIRRIFYLEYMTNNSYFKTVQVYKIFEEENSENPETKTKTAKEITQDVMKNAENDAAKKVKDQS